MNWSAVIAIIVLAVLTFVLGHLTLKYRAMIRRTRDSGYGAPIPTVALEAFDPVFACGPFGPTTAAEVRFLGEGDGVPGGASDRETWILAVLATRARSLFEFGTCTGKTAYLWAINSPADAAVATLTLAPQDQARYAHAEGDAHEAQKFALRESSFTEFLYSGTAAEPKIRQLFGDSKALDTAPWQRKCDLIFVDGSHARSYVESDSRKALAMVAPGGIVLWHDYRGPTGSTRDVYHVLNELSRDVKLARFAGTSLVAYRAPAG
ncbi:MAG TPA: class I SAM-dependent methyltransferase [Gemmatimonadaceae bacterium]|jgi:predicted O-methyltransferase YrrM|nr:class I SAM-dependent methyltransferase [Gemmatimonadaceae bacterium]